MRDYLILALLFFLFGLPAGYAQTTPLPDPRTDALTLVWMHPSATPAITEVNRHLEVGFRLDMEHRRMIDNFLDKRNVPEVMNPFDPEHLDAVATFERIDPASGQVIERHERIAFWYREYERDYSSEDPNEWTHRELENRFQMRARFTPENTGIWRVQVNLNDRWGRSTTTNQTFFEVVDATNAGFLKVGETGRFFVRDGASFFPVGQNLPCPSCHPEVDPTCEQIDCAGKEPWCQGKVMGPYGFQVFEDEMSALANVGGNYMRFLITPWNLEIEFEELNNYDQRMHCAWETDRLLEHAENLGILLHFNMQIHYNLENPSIYGMWHWDFDDLECYPHDDAYCYTRELELQSPLDFLQSERALKHYKNRIRYMIARYGHSTAIGVFELFSEANNIGQGYETNERCGNDKSKPRNKPYQSDDAYPPAVAKWHRELARFIKEDLKHDQHIIAVNYTGRPDYVRGDDSFYSPHVDLATYNYYNLAVGKYYNAYRHVGRFHYRDPRKMITNERPPAINKPLMFSETGPGFSGVERCDSDLRWIKSVWLSAFTGTAGTAMNWSNQFDFELWRHLGDLQRMMKPYDFDGKRFEPQGVVSSDETFDLVALVAGKGPKEAIGALHNRTVNFYTRSTRAHRSCRDTAALNNLVLFPQYMTASDRLYQRRERVSRIENMGIFRRYIVQFYDPIERVFFDRVEVRSGLSGGLNIPHPPFRADGSPIYIFTVERLRLKND